MKQLPQHEIDQFIQKAASVLDSMEHSPDPEFSEEYLQKKSILLEKHKRRKSRRHKRMALIAVAILLSISLAACTKPNQEFFIQVYEQFTSYFFTGQEYRITDLSIEFGYLPEGFVLANEIQQDTVYIATYQKGGDEVNTLKIRIDSSSTKRSNINNENVTGHEITVNGSS